MPSEHPIKVFEDDTQGAHQSVDLNPYRDMPTSAITAAVEALKSSVLQMVTELRKRNEVGDTEIPRDWYLRHLLNTSVPTKPCTYKTCMRTPREHGRCYNHKYPSGTVVCDTCWSVDYDRHLLECEGEPNVV